MAGCTEWWTPVNYYCHVLTINQLAPLMFDECLKVGSCFCSNHQSSEVFLLFWSKNWKIHLCNQALKQHFSLCFAVYYWNIAWYTVKLMKDHFTDYLFIIKAKLLSFRLSKYAIIANSSPLIILPVRYLSWYSYY